MRSRFVIADVFTQTSCAGNQLAVFPNAEGISVAVMQRLAREFNFAESAFVLPPEQPGHTARVRIFTPRAEVPFAGHPTIGTAAVIAAERSARGSGPIAMTLGEGIGPVAVVVEPAEAATFSRFSIEPALEYGPQPSRAHAAAAVGLREEDLVEAWSAGVGLRFCFLRMASDALVDRAKVDHGIWSAHFANAWSPNLFVFAGSMAPGSDWYARMFAPALGVEEDPATGSACAALAALAAERAGSASGAYSWHVRQGVAMGRPSEIEAAATVRDRRVATVTIGGYTVLTGEGEMTVPDDA